MAYTNKSLGRMRKRDLQIMLEETIRNNDALSAENGQLRHSLAIAQEKQRELENKPMQVAKVGSIAEAALQANGFFEAAQQSADDYLREIKRLRDQVAARSAAQVAKMGGEPQYPIEQSPDIQAQIQAQAQAQAEEYRQFLQSQLEMRLKEQRERLQAQMQEQLRAAQQQAATTPDKMMQDAQKQANLVVSQANAQAQALIANARSKSDEMIAEANKQSQDIIDQANRRADLLINAASLNSDPTSTGKIMRKGRHVKPIAASM